MKKQNDEIENLINNECKSLFQKISDIINEKYDEEKLEDMMKLEQASKTVLQF